MKEKGEGEGGERGRERKREKGRGSRDRGGRMCCGKGWNLMGSEDRSVHALDFRVSDFRFGFRNSKFKTQVSGFKFNGFRGLGSR
eukprot:94516-Rhodomonas_salina.2